jgi:hypothetical protein
LTLSGLKTLRFFKTCLKGIVKYPPRRSKQLPKGIAIALTFLFFVFRVHHNASSVRFMFSHYKFYPESQPVRMRGKSGVTPYKTLQHVDGYSYSQFDHIIFHTC